MTSLYSQYIKEREGLDIIENEHGFCSYKIQDNWVFIQDIFITKDQRLSKLATELADKVVDKALKNGAKVLYSHVDTNALNWEDSVKFIEKYGCVAIKFDKDTGLIYFQKKIG